MIAPIFLDIETIFREPARTGLEAAYPPMPPGNSYVDSLSVLGTQKEVETFLVEARPSLEALQRLVDLEVSTKNRAGVSQILQKEIAKYTEDPIPKSVKMMPECCEVIAVGFGDTVFMGPEKQILLDVWDAWETMAAVPYGWRLATFDIPVLVAASSLHGIALPSDLRISSRYNYDGFVDMASKRPWDGKLRDICLATGFAGDVDDPLGSGAAVARAYDEGRMADIVQHCRVDLDRCSHLYELYKGYLW